MTNNVTLTDEQTWQWPDALDALIASPNHHTLMYENDKVRVLNTRIAPGERTAVHTHRWPSVTYLISFSPFVRYDDHDVILFDTRTVESMKNPPPVLWTPILPPHSLENVGTTDLIIFTVEIKDGR